MKHSPLMPFARGDMRDHIVSHKNDHGASYGRYAVLQWWSRLKISFGEIFGVVQFSTFATQSAKSGRSIDIHPAKLSPRQRSASPIPGSPNEIIPSQKHRPTT